uniref:Family with sequence similarity 47 member E n=1 Tax=Molossus molossus TaxID=27622 RepID=A0A7J8JSX8_MOLMO|nr:family with sequence similarity 47 member E [Molossus molossus]
MANDRRLFRPKELTGVGRNCRPRYREKVPSQCFTNAEARPPYPTTMNAKRWVFVRNGLDDFRTGCPPCEEGMILRGLEENRPPRRSKEQNELLQAVKFSKLSAAQLARKAFVADIEAQLTPHPLARFPNLREDMPPELLLKVLKVLDPDRKLADAWARCEGIEQKPKEPEKLLKKRPTQEHPGLLKKTPQPPPVQSLKKAKPKEKDLLHEDAPDPYERARKAVSDLCNWATEIGCSKIDEEYIMKQFELDYQCEPSHDQVRIVNLDQVPSELKKKLGITKKQQSTFFPDLGRKPQNSSKPKYVKMRYGAWYLNPKLWKWQPADEPLVDPKLLCKDQDENLKKMLQKEEEEFAKLHGPFAFKEFILRKGYRMPSFLEKIDINKGCQCGCNKTAGE